MTSPPISPLTYNASNEEDTFWSGEAGETDNNNNKVTEQLSHLPTPKIGNRAVPTSSKRNKRMGDSSVNGMLAGARNEDDGSVTSLASVWRRLQRKRSGDATKKKEASFDTAGTSEEESLKELEENDAFALEVGLMFSTDDGDTIANADAYSQGLPHILTMDSFECDVPSSDLSAYLNSHRHTTAIPGASTQDDDSVTRGYIHNTKYAVRNHPQHNPFFNDDDTHTTFRDDHGNRLPPNAKAILTFKKKRSDANNNTNNAAFPSIPNTTSYQSTTTNDYMEKRLRNLAGQLNSDWRTGSTTFIASPALARRLRDFQFAREKRRKKYGHVQPWGILGLYHHLSGVRIDVEWAEDAAWRRRHAEPYLTWGDFESAKGTGRNRPFFTYGIVSVCTAMMFAAWFVNGWHFESLAVNPMIGPSAETLLRLGAKESYRIVQEEEIWRLVSPMVLHAGLIHYVLNMFALWYVGTAIESIHGHFQAATAFVVPAIGGIILSAIFLPQYITVGASGGIFGLIGACISDIVMNWNLLFNEFVNERGTRMSHARVLVILLIDIILNCLIGLTPFVDNFTHLGGMIYGFLCGLSTIQLVSLRFFGEEKHCAHKAKLFFFRFFGLLVSMAGIIVSSVFLFSGDGETNPCPSCSVMSCVPFPPWKGPNEKWWYCDDCSQATAEGTLNTSTGKFIEMDLTCPDESIVNVKVDETWPQDELGLEEMLPMLCRERCI